MTPDQNAAAFLEVHYYKGGLRSDFVAQGNERPAWAPRYDAVGFRDEVALTGSDQVLEVAKFSAGEAIVSWVGIYRHSPDEVYGDRQNHVGIGIWLCGLAPAEPALLIGALESLLDVHRRNDPAFVAKSKKFLTDYVTDITVDYAALPYPLGGLKTANGLALETALYCTDSAGSERDKIIDDIVFRLFYLSNSSSPANRALVFLAESGSIKAVPQHFEALKPLRSNRSLLALLPGALQAQKDDIASLKRQVDQETRKSYELHETIDRFQAEKSQAEAKISSLEKDYLDLRDSIEADSDLQRHASILNHLATQDRKLEAAVESISALRSDLLRDLRHEISQIKANTKPYSSEPSTGSGGYNRHPSRSGLGQTGPSHAPPFNWEPILWIFGVLMIVSLVGAAIYFIPRWMS